MAVKERPDRVLEKSYLEIGATIRVPAKIGDCCEAEGILPDEQRGPPLGFPDYNRSLEQ